MRLEDLRARSERILSSVTNRFTDLLRQLKTKTMISTIIRIHYERHCLPYLLVCLGFSLMANDRWINSCQSGNEIILLSDVQKNTANESSWRSRRTHRPQRCFERIDRATPHPAKSTELDIKLNDERIRQYAGGYINRSSPLPLRRSTGMNCKPCRPRKANSWITISPSSRAGAHRAAGGRFVTSKPSLPKRKCEFYTDHKDSLAVKPITGKRE